MKITILTGPFLCLPPDAIGAIEKRWYLVGKKWISQGDDVTFICKKPMNCKKQNDYIYIKGYERTGNWFKDFFLDFIYSMKALKKVSSTDILVLNSIWSPILSRMYKKKFKISIYNVARFPKHQMGIYHKFGKIDCFCCTSNATYNALLEQNSNLQSSSCVIPNFIDTHVFNGKKVRSLSNTPTIVYSGRVHSEKGLDLLMKAVEKIFKHHNMRLRILIIGAKDKARGGSGEKYVYELEKLAPNCEIIWVDAIYNPKDLAIEIAKGDIFCYPSVAERGETFGVAPLEAMGLGLPVIVSNLECFKDFISNGENGIVFNHRAENAVDELESQLWKLLTNPELFKKCSFKGMQTSQHFSVEAIAEKYHKKFEELLNGKSLS